eukprot:gene19798-biopygen20411
MVKWVGMPRSENEWKTREDLEFDRVGRKAIPNRALQEFEKVEVKKQEREKGRVTRKREDTTGAIWLTNSQEFQTDGMSWIPDEERADDEFSKRFPGCEVISVDIQLRWEPTHCENVLHWDYRQFSPNHFDVIWASPPCTEYNETKTLGERNLRNADRQVRRTLEIIKYLQPTFYFIENPRAQVLWRDENERESHDERVYAHLAEADEEPAALMPEYVSTPPPVMSDDSEWDTLWSESA